MRWLRRVLGGRPAAPTFDGRDADEVVRCGDLVLHVHILHAGTRSEGRVGRLFRGDEEVAGQAAGETVVARDGDDEVTFEFLGDDRPHLWSRSGWAVRTGPEP